MITGNRMDELAAVVVVVRIVSAELCQLRMVRFQKLCQ